MTRARTSLRRQLFLLAAAAILPLALMAGVGLLALYQQQVRQTERAALEIARALSTAVDADLALATALLQFLSGATELDRDDLASFHEIARRALETRPGWSSILLHDGQRRIVVDASIPFGEPAYPTAEPVSLERVFAAGRPLVGTLAHGSRAQHAFPVRVPVLRQGEVRYVLTAVVRPDGILDVVNRQRLHPDWVISVFDSANRRVARSRQHAQFLGGGPSPSLQALIAGAGGEGTGLTDALEGDRVYTAFSRSAQSGWSVAIGIPEDFVRSAALGSLLAYASGFLVSLLLGALVALLIARRIARPMQALRAAAVALGRREPVHVPDTPIAELRQVGASIETAAAERTRNDAEREDLLRREQAARAAADAANRAKDEFLAMLGHELRNPLGAISNAVRVLESPHADVHAMTHATTIIGRQAAHLARLTDDLLDAGRAILGKIALQREPLELAAAAARTLSVLRATGRLQQRRVVEDLEPAWVDADPTRVEQILTNLLVNALKYTGEGGTIRVTVRTQGGSAVLTVADDGIGMSGDLAPRVFDLFVQGERGLDRAHGGLGIGLTLVRRLAELHGGSASAESDGLGRGSAFTVRLPAIDAPHEKPAAATQAAPALRRNILVVEDNDDARDTLCQLLQYAGHRVNAARDGVAGLDAALAGKHEVVLVDVGLPRLDGYELAQRIREAERDAGGAERRFLVALTGYGLAEDRRRALDAGFDAHLVKPVDQTELEALLSAPRA